MRFFRKLKTYFREGAKFWLPVVLMTLLILWVVNKLIAIGAMLIGWFGLLQAAIFVVSLFVSIAIFGWLRTKVSIFAALLGSVQSRIENFPLAGRVFKVLRQTVEILLTHEEEPRQRYLGVVMLRPTGHGAWNVALLTNSFDVGGRTKISCYVPPGLNALVGVTYWLYADQKDCVHMTSLTVEEGLQAILSYGMVVPNVPQLPDDPPGCPARPIEYEEHGDYTI